MSPAPRPDDPRPRPDVTVVVGIDGSGRTHRLHRLAAAHPGARWAGPGTDSGDALEGLLRAAAADGRPVLVDDAHLLDAATLRRLLAAVREQVVMTISRRPTIEQPDLAALDAELAAAGSVEVLGPLEEPALAAILTDAGIPRPAAEVVTALQHASAGLAAVAAAVATAPAGSPAPALVARVQRHLALLDPTVVRLAHILALRLDLPDDVLAAATDLGPEQLATALRTLRDEGLLAPPGETMVPAVAEIIVADLPPAQLRRLHDAVARGLLAVGGDLPAAATRLRAARARSGRAGEVYRAAGEQVRFTDPAAARDWFDDALDAGEEPALLAAGRAEAEALLGLPVDTQPPPGTPEDHRRRLRLVEAAVAAHQGRAGRAADLLLAAGGPGPVLAVPSLLATGRSAEARERSAQARERSADHDRSAPGYLALLAEAALGLDDPPRAVPTLLEAVEAMEAARIEAVLPDTAHAVTAVIAVTAGDAPTAAHVLQRAVDTGLGGPAAAERHRLLLAWVHLRAGRFDTAVAALARSAGTALAGRERLLRSALEAGLARRSGDIAQLRDAWAGAEQALARHTVDLLQLEALEELLVAAARLRRPQRVGPVLDTLQTTLDQLGRPPAWMVSLGWLRLQLAVCVEDAEATRRHADAVRAARASAPRQAAQQLAAGCWADVLAGAVDVSAVREATAQLVAGELPWEASRLAGQAAIRSSDPGTARRLLEHARELSSTEAQLDDERPAAAGLSEREVEVGQLVLAGRTHREIGAQLYLSPKTVEHHVARIRTKLGATTRAEFLAALRSALDGTAAQNAR